MRLIDADKLCGHKFPLTPLRYHVGWNDAIDAIIENAPTIEDEVVKRGEWEKIEDDYCGLSIIKCSLCHEEWCFECFDDAEQLNYHYCPNCGAKMDLEE